jgi:hypothetical protein
MLTALSKEPAEDIAKRTIIKKKITLCEVTPFSLRDVYRSRSFGRTSYP